MLDVEVKGALNVKLIYKDELLSIFIQPPSLETLKERLVNRGTESEESLNERLERAKMEMTYATSFDYTVVNDDLTIAYNQVKKLVETFINAY